MERLTQSELEQLRSLLRGDPAESAGAEIDDERLLAWREGTLPPTLQSDLDRKIAESPELAARVSAMGEPGSTASSPRLIQWVWVAAAVLLLAIVAWRWFQDPERALLRGDWAHAWSAVAGELPEELRAELLAQGGLDSAPRLKAARESRAQREAVEGIRIVSPQSNLIEGRPAFVWRGDRGAAETLALFEIGVEEPVLELDALAAQSLGSEHTLELPAGFIVKPDQLYRWVLSGPTERAEATFRRFGDERRSEVWEQRRAVREATGSYPTLELYVTALVDDLAGLRLEAWRKLSRLAREHSEPLFLDAWRASEIRLGLQDE